MSDKKENGKSPTAQDLLTRLKKPKNEENAGEKKAATTYEAFVAGREPKKKKEAFSVDEAEIAALTPDPADEITPEDVDFSSIYDEVYAEVAAEAEAAEAAAAEPGLDGAAAEFFGADATQDATDGTADGADYGDYYPDDSLSAYSEYGEFVDTDAVSPDAYETYEPAYDEGAYVEPYADAGDDGYADDGAYADDGYYEDVIPDDDFFDNDPIDDDAMYADEPAAPQTHEEYDEERDFENLVNEVTGGAPVDELDESDISLMVALGMEDELAKTMGEETASQLADDYIADQEEWVDRTNRFGADEYSDPDQNNDIADTYRRRHKLSFLGMLVSFAFMVVLLIFENITVFTQYITGTPHYFAGAFNAEVYPVVYIMVDLQLLLLCALPVLGRVFKGIGDLVKFKYTVDCLPALLFVFALINTVIMSMTTTPGAAPVLFNFVCALCLFVTAVNEFMTVRREIFSFNIISSRKPKFVMRRLSTRDSVLESEAVAEMDSDAADEGDIIKIQKTDFVDGYFWRTKAEGTVSRSVVGLATVISFALAVVVTVYAFVVKAQNPVNIGFAVLCAAVPASMVVSGFYPFYRANRKAYDNDSTIIGESSVEEYSGVGVISFDDVNVFPSYSVKVRNVRLFNNSRIDKVLYYAASVFSATGGPLADVFEVATMETGHSENVRILETGAGYIEAEVAGRSIMFGKAPALATRGILIPDEIVSEDTSLPADCSVMYMIYQRKLVAKMIVNYVLDPDFEYVLKQLTGSGMCVCVKTFDPNIDEEMILRQLPQTNYAMRVIKYKNTEEITKYSKRAEGGIVSRDNTKSLLHTVSSCDKILSAQKTGFVIGIISAILNAIIVAVVLMAGSFASLCSFYLVLCQLFWLVPVVISTKLIVR